MRRREQPGQERAAIRGMDGPRDERVFRPGRPRAAEKPGRQPLHGPRDGEQGQVPDWIHRFYCKAAVRVGREIRAGNEDHARPACPEQGRLGSVKEKKRK